MNIGTTIWIFDINRRKYRPGGVGGGPIWREHWRPETIRSETSRSWVTDYGTKIPKKPPLPNNIADSLEAINRAAYVEENRHRIAESIYRIRDYDTLTKIADLIGYKPRTE